MWIHFLVPSLYNIESHLHLACAQLNSFSLRANSFSLPKRIRFLYHRCDFYTFHVFTVHHSSSMPFSRISQKRHRRYMIIPQTANVFQPPPGSVHHAASLSACVGDHINANSISELTGHWTQALCGCRNIIFMRERSLTDGE